MNFIENESEQKLRGGYYTPLDLATYITRWTIEKRPKTILEPSCGDGIFIQAISSLGFTDQLSFIGFELLKEEAAKALQRCQNEPRLDSTIYAQDFLGWAIDKMTGGQVQFDSVVGNPPFIRYQYLPVDAQHKAETIFKMLHLPSLKIVETER